jgi:hypothetical protein
MCKCNEIKMSRKKSNFQVFAKEARIADTVHIVELEDDQLGVK